MNNKKILFILFILFLFSSIFLSVGYTFFFNYVTTQVFVVINAFFALSFLIYLGFYSYNNYTLTPKIINVMMLIWFIVLTLDHLSSMFFAEGFFGIISLFQYPLYILTISVPYTILLPSFTFFKKSKINSIKNNSD